MGNFALSPMDPWYIIRYMHVYIYIHCTHHFYHGETKNCCHAAYQAATKTKNRSPSAAPRPSPLEVRQDLPKKLAERCKYLYTLLVMPLVRSLSRKCIYIYTYIDIMLLHAYTYIYMCWLTRYPSQVITTTICSPVIHNHLLSLPIIYHLSLKTYPWS